MYLTFYCDFCDWLIQINHKMRTKFSGILTLLLALVVQLTFAQEKTISGSVTDNTGLPLPGVNIIVKGTSEGTQSDFDGNYTVQANVGQTLVFSYVGFKTVEQAVTTVLNTFNLQMVEDAALLEEVVVTAQGIKREKKALGYAVSTVSSEEIEQKSVADVARVLAGKTAGVEIINQNGISGSGTSVVIRGFTSFSQSNQALFIVDGVPFDTSTNAQGSFVNGNAGSSRFLDLDPNNILSISVLKGLAAATLYGADGRNGVILITTKNGDTGSVALKNEVEITQSVFFNEIASLPDYQNKYGNGFDQAHGWFFSNWGPKFEKDGLGGWGQFVDDDDLINSKPYHSDGTLAHPYSTSGSAAHIGFFPEFDGARVPWVPTNAVRDFFRTGVITNTNINVRGSSDNGKVTYNTNFSNLDETGFTPGNKLTRVTFGIGGRAVLSNKFTVNGTMNYSKTDFTSPPIAASGGSSTFGQGSSIFGDLFYTPRNINIQDLPFENSLGQSVYYRQDNGIQHPLWTVNNASTGQLTNRFYGTATVQYDFNDNLNVIYRAGIDFYNERNTYYQNKGGVSNNATARVLFGVYDVWDNNNTIFNHNLILSGDYDLTDDIGLQFNVGASSVNKLFDQNGLRSTGQIVYGFLRHNNFTAYDPVQFTEENNTIGVYGSASFDYDNYVYATVSGRNDWVSNFSQDNRSLFYPSASLSFIPTSAFDGLRSENGINFLKLRVGYGTSAGFAPGFPTSTTLSTNAVYFIDDGGSTLIQNTTSSVLANPDLKPERVDEIEVGVEATLLARRITLDFSYYERETRDLIVRQPLPPSVGFTSTRTNIGKIEGYGIEAQLSIDVLRSDTNGFEWTTGAIFTSNETEVTELVEGTDQIVYAGFTNLGNAAQVGQPLGVIVGTAILRLDQNNPALAGNAVVDGIGNYTNISQDENGLVPVIGDPNPDWTMSFTNTIRFKNFSLSALVTHIRGGDMYSQTISTLLGRGLTTDTEDRLGTFILPGINSETGEENQLQINNSDFYFGNIFAGNLNELEVYDASVVRLQEVSLGYSFTSKMLEKTPFGSFSITASGYNLWYDAYNMPSGINFDPNAAGIGIGNGKGFEYLTAPSSKRYGFSVKATF